MADDVYTLGVWRVQEGRQDEFIAAWQDLGAVFGALRHPPAGIRRLLELCTEASPGTFRVVAESPAGPVGIG